MADLSVIEELDGMAGLRNALRHIASAQGHWAGIPMPLTNERLVVEPNYPNAKGLMDLCKPEDDGPPSKYADATIRNEFWSCRRMSTVIVFEHNGKIKWGLEPGIHHFSMDLATLGCADAWGIEQESKAIHTLATLVSHRQFKQYMLTGMFMEASKRSSVHYVLRRLKPTVAVNVVKDQLRIMCTLCLHPIAYYAGTWAGAMCPTDDVIAHLMLMRGDEPMFWRRANQHPSWVPQSGL